MQSLVLLNLPDIVYNSYEPVSGIYPDFAHGFLATGALLLGASRVDDQHPVGHNRDSGDSLFRHAESRSSCCSRVLFALPGGPIRAKFSLPTSSTA
jgi:hypothetical protein